MLVLTMNAILIVMLSIFFSQFIPFFGEPTFLLRSTTASPASILVGLPNSNSVPFQVILPVMLFSESQNFTDFAI